jgi:hypothetical protein
VATLFLQSRRKLYQPQFVSWWPSVVFIAVAASAYILFPQYLIQHHDGKFHFVLLRTLVTWNDATPLGLSTSPLAGMSALFPPLVPKLIPTLWPSFIKMDAYWQIYSTYVLLAIFLYFSTDLMPRSLGFDNSLALAALANSQAIALAIPPGTPLRMIIGYLRAARLISHRVGGHRCTQSWRIVVLDRPHHIGRDRIRRSACMLYRPEN